MLKAQEIVDNVLRLVDQKSAKSEWHVAITNKDKGKDLNEQDLPDYARDLLKKATPLTGNHQKNSRPVQLKSIYYEATDYKEARKAVSLLLRQGFGGTSASPPLTISNSFALITYKYPQLPPKTPDMAADRSR